MSGEPVVVSIESRLLALVVEERPILARPATEAGTTQKFRSGREIQKFRDGREKERGMVVEFLKDMGEQQLAGQIERCLHHGEG